MWPSARRPLARLFSVEPLRSFGRGWYASSSRQILRSARGLPEILEAKTLTENIAQSLPVVSDLDFFLRLNTPSSVETVGNIASLFLGLARTHWMLGEVTALDPPLESLVEHYQATPLFWRDWPQNPQLAPMARMGLGIHFLKEAWRRWLMFDGRKDRLFHERAIFRCTTKGLRALESRETPSKNSSEGLAQLFVALSHSKLSASRILSGLRLTPPDANPDGSLLWSAQSLAWQRATGDLAPSADWSLPGVMECELGIDPKFWQAYHRAVHSNPKWVRELAPLPLPPSAVASYLEGWTGFWDADFSQTIQGAASWLSLKCLPDTWPYSAAAALRDRILTRFCFILGNLCRGGNAKLLDLSPERKAVVTLFPDWDEDKGPARRPTPQILEWMAAVLRRMEK